MLCLYKALDWGDYVVAKSLFVARQIFVKYLEEDVAMQCLDSKEVVCFLTSDGPVCREAGYWVEFAEALDQLGIVAVNGELNQGEPLDVFASQLKKETVSEFLIY